MNLQGQNETLEFEQHRKKNKKHQMFGALFLLVVTIAVLYALFRANDFDETIAALTSASGIDLVLAVVCLIIYILICPLSLCVLCKAKKTKVSLVKSYLIGASEHFFNNITPYQTGAQPFQVYSFSKGKVKAAEGTGLVICNYLAFLIALNTLIIASLFFSKDFFGSFSKGNMMWIPMIGVIMNLFTLVMFLCIIMCKWVREAFKKCLRWLCKFKWIGKRCSKSIPVFEAYCDSAQQGAREVLEHPKAFAMAVLLRAVSLLFYYAIPFFILRSLNVNITYDYFFYTILATCFAVNAVVWIPTPGTSGGIEMSFTILFSIFTGFSGAVAAAAAILWRALTYYLLIIVSFLQYIVLEIMQKREEKGYLAKKIVKHSLAAQQMNL